MPLVSQVGTGLKCVTTTHFFDKSAAEQTHSAQKTSKAEEYVQFSRGEIIICREIVIAEQAFSSALYYVMIATIPPSLSTNSSQVSVVVFVCNTEFVNILNVAVSKVRRKPLIRDLGTLFRTQMYKRYSSRPI